MPLIRLPQREPEITLTKPRSDHWEHADITVTGSVSASAMPLIRLPQRTRNTTWTKNRRHSKDGWDKHTHLYDAL
jgi:hypothetical protein